MEGHITHDGTAIVCREKGWPLTDLSLKERSVALGKPTASSMMAGHGSDPGQRGKPRGWATMSRTSSDV